MGDDPGLERAPGGPGRRERCVLPDAPAFAATLRAEFGVEPEVLGPDRMARLWSQACAQHDAWQPPRIRGDHPAGVWFVTSI